jgi:hypothetical protein
MTPQVSPSPLHPSAFLKLLRQINEGVVIYEPFLRLPDKLQEFQDTVARLQEMERQGLVGRLFIQTRIYRGEECIDFVMVTGGLTEEGKRLLRDNLSEVG